jgi:hypothetical protein
MSTTAVVQDWISFATVLQPTCTTTGQLTGSLGECQKGLKGPDWRFLQ